VIRLTQRWKQRMRVKHEQEERVRAATQEAELSRQRLETVRKEVVEPLKAAGRRNSFADLIRQSLITGHHGKAE
jgi:hypothetical protein